MSQLISDIILFISVATEKFFRLILLTNYSTLQLILDVLLVALLFYWCILLIKGTRAVQVVIGLAILGVLFLISHFFKLIALGWLLDKLLTLFLVAIPIIFQSELRRGLEKLGQTRWSVRRRALYLNSIISNITEAAFNLAEKKAGALIVIRGSDSLHEIIETGITLNAKLSRELLETLFHPKTPLHDGAVIIEEQTIKAAGCILPLFSNQYGHEFGVRHKAALTLSEQTDTHIIVVSEEKGTVSYVHNGKITKDISAEHLRKILLRTFQTPFKKQP